MKKYLSIIAIVTTIATMLTSCSEKSPKMLILYYSQTGVTESVATEIQKMTGADIERFDVEEAYSGNYAETIARVQVERQNGTIPTLKPLTSDLSKYDMILLGYPVWFGTYAPPVKALLASVDLSGKKIVPFCTFGSGGLYSSASDLKAALPESEIADGYGVRAARVQYAPEELERFLIESGLVAGEIDPLPEFSEQDVVTPEELALYNEATSSYMFPLGEPVSVAARTVPGGVDFCFIVNTTTPDGQTTEGKIYVVRRNGRPAEFTQVVR